MKKIYLLLTTLFFVVVMASSQTLTIEKVSVSGCYFSGGQSKAVVTVQVGWTGLAAVSNANRNITVTWGSQTRTITPEVVPSGANTKIVTPQVVTFEVLSNGATGTITAANIASGTKSANYTAPAACIPTSCGSGELGGQVFDDFNANGTKDAAETQGEAGITVTGYAIDGTVYTTTTDKYGKWKLNIPTAKYCVRVEFSNIPSSLRSSSTIAGGTTVQFAAAPTCNIDLGVLNTNDYSQSNPDVYVPIWYNGNPSHSSLSNNIAISKFSYNSTGSPLSGGASSNIGPGVIPYAQAGPLWGVAWSKQAKKLYASAILRRHAGLGPQGLAGLYTYTPTTNTTVGLDLSTLGLNFGTIGSNAARGLGDPQQPSYDLTAFSQVGKVGIGGITMSEDGTTLYVMNLFEKKIHAIPVATLTNPANGGIVSYNVPSSTCGGAGVTRPWSVKYYKDKLYIGTVCDAATSQNKSDLTATVYELNLTTSVFTEKLTFPLTYPKGYPNNGVNTGWFPWTDDGNDLITKGGGGTNTGYPTPIFADIDFDIDGSMVFVFNDRSATQWGYENYRPDAAQSNTTLYKVNAGGDILRASNDDGIFTLENAGKSGDKTGANTTNNEGPGFGEFFNDNFSCCHTETVSGGVGIKPGSGEVAVVAMDPDNAGGMIYAGGVKYMSNSNGSFSRGYNTYGGPSGIQKTFGKSNGLGDLVFAIDLPSYSQIGNRVWFDTDGNGIQDPCEAGINGVTMKLYSSTGTLLATTTTANGGLYTFGNGVSGVNLVPGTDYYVVAGHGTQYASNTLTVGSTTYGPITLPLTGNGTIPTNNDNNGTIAPNAGVTAGFAGFPYALVQGPVINTVNHTIDFGFKCNTVSNFTIGTIDCIDASNPTSSVVYTNTSTGATSYSWNLGNSQTFTTTNATGAYTTANSYNVKLVATAANGCKDSVTKTVVIPSCTVTGGGGGGVESKSLGDVIGNRNYGIYKAGLNGNENYSNRKTLQPAQTSRVINSNATQSVGINTSLSDLMPYQVDASFVPYITSPTDLTGFTNAVEVRSIDFTKGTVAKAVAFATKSIGSVYSHTKPICDRLKGAEILNVENIAIGGYNFIQYTLKQQTGIVEYAISFTASTKAGRNSFAIQSNWMTKDYVTTDDVLFNYQLWAANPANAQTMVVEVLNKLRGLQPVQQLVNAALPDAYIASGLRKGTSVDLNVKNNTTYTSGYFELSEKKNEQSSAVVRVVPFTVNAKGQSSVSIPVSDAYESDIRMYMNGQLQDLVYMSDGIWGVDYNRNTTTVSQFNTINDASRVYKTEEYALLRNVQVQASSPDYVSIYKFLRGGAMQEDLTAYKSLQFTAKADNSANVKVTITKAGISNWNNQYTYYIKGVDNASRLYQIALDDFKSVGSTDKLTAKDVTSVVFSIESTTGRIGTLGATLTNAAFSKEDIGYLRSLSVKDLSVYPNPSKGKFNVSFKAERDGIMQLNVTDITGRVVNTRTVNATKGSNQVQVEMKASANNNVYFITLEGIDGKYNVQRVLMNK